ncbi:MAG: tetratricopeptide repeat protein [Thermoanaerobaculia bacterium]
MRNREKVVPFGRTRRTPDPAKLAEFTATAKRLQEEREAAVVVDALLAETPRDEWQTLIEREEMRTNGALERLGQLAAGLEQDPLQALRIAELATDIADTLPETTYPHVMLAQMRANAWKDRGQALCYLSRTDEALSALEEAVKRLSNCMVLSHDMAVVNFVRAIVLQHVRRFGESQTLLAECREVFHQHGDLRLYGKCTLSEGNLRVRRGDFAGAREVLRPFVLRAEPEARAIARVALGWCEIHVGDPADALHHFEAAGAYYQQKGWKVETTRAAYGAGSALLRLGRIDDAIAELASARELFLERNFAEEAGLSGLEIVECHLLRGEHDEARELASTIVREFAAASLNRRAVAAIASLNEAIAASSATPEFARNVHLYVQSLRFDPEREYAIVN